MDIWLAEYTTGFKPQTLKSYRSHIKNHIKPSLGSVKLQQLHASTIQALYNSLLKAGNGLKPLSSKSVRNLHGVIHSALEQAVELGYIQTNPSKKCKLPKITRHEIQPLGDMTTAFLDAIKDHRYETPLLCESVHRMRQSELIGLTWDCVDFERSTIYIYR